MTKPEPVRIGAAEAQSISDEEIARRVVEGETVLFEIIMRRYNQRLYRTVRSILGNEDEAEDAMQQAYVQAYTKLSQFEGRARFSTWLTSIAVNEALARLRRRKFGLVAVGGEDNILEMAESHGPTPESSAIGSELREIVEREISRLPETYRTVVVLREVEELSTEETAQVLGIEVDAVKTRLHRARAALRDALFERAGLTLHNLFPFEAPRCNRVVENVLRMIGEIKG